MGATRILITSNVSGPTQIYAVDPAGKAKVGQLTFDPARTCDSAEACGVDDPLPSPDGRHLLYRTHYNVYRDGAAYPSDALWVTRWDGAASRRVWPHGDDEVARVGSVAWAPDSRKFAFVVLAPDRSIRVAVADGSGERVIRNRAVDSLIAWSPRGQTIRLFAGLPSPDQRWVAQVDSHYPDSSISVRDARGVRKVLSGAWTAAWSPDSKLLAYAGTRGVGVLVLATKKTRRLADERATQLAFAPDGRSIGYLTSGGDLRRVTLSGARQDIVSAAGPYGAVLSFAWTRSPRLSFRLPKPLDGLYTRSIVRELAADGARVAFATCTGVGVWTVPTGAVVQGPAAGCNSTSFPLPISTLAVARSRIAYGSVGGGNTTVWSLGGMVLEPTVASFTLTSGSNTRGLPLPQVAGAGELLVYSTRSFPPGEFGVRLEWQIHAVGPAGCDCRLLTSFRRPYSEPVALDVDDGRVLAVGREWIEVFAADGRPLLLLEGIPAPALLYVPAEAVLAGPDLVLRVGAQLRDYDAATGARTHTWPLALAPDGRREPTLQDTARGLVAYSGRGVVHVLRLSDGRDQVVGNGDLARFLDAGLAYAEGARIHLVPFSKLQ